MRITPKENLRDCVVVHINLPEPLRALHLTFVFCFRTVEGEKSLVMGASGSHLCISLHNDLFLRFASGLLRAFCVVFLSNTNVLNLGH